MRVRRGTRVLTTLICALLSHPVFAHPMGNFSVNHYSKITLATDGITVQYFIDLAEIPAYQELQQGGIPSDSKDSAVVRFVAARGAELAQGLRLTVNGTSLPLRVRSSDVIFPPGAGGLPTMKMGFVYEAAYPTDLDRTHFEVHYEDRNYPGQIGWKEVLATAPGGSLSRSSVPPTDRSSGLTNYSADLLSSPPQDLEASIDAWFPPPPRASASAPSTKAAEHVFEREQIHARQPGVRLSAPKAARRSAIVRQAPASTRGSQTSPTGAQQTSSPRDLVLQPNRRGTPRYRFAELIGSQHLGLWFLITSAFISMGLGGLHALEPGHGKTIVAAYLVSSRGTARQAVLLGLIVTASHTAGVFALGAITVYASRYIVPERLYPWLGVLSGIIIVALGCSMLLGRLAGTATDHSHLSGSLLRRRMLARPCSEECPTGDVEQTSVNRAGWGQLIALGISGGSIPCPAALIVLLSAFALNRIALAFFLILAFSVGLAAVLIGLAMLMVYARSFITQLRVDGPLTTRWLPIISAGIITALGVVVTIQGIGATHVSGDFLSTGRFGPALLVGGLGLMLGVRHSTDADHVVAISTIISKQRGIWNAALIGSIWGLGHTITIFVIGSLIILYGVEIPPRLGLAMEFSVAVMLILLGALNLTGVMQKITRRYQSSSSASSEPPAGSDRYPKVRWIRDSIERLGLYQCLRPLVIGLVHGLAGSAAVALLVLSTIHNPVWATVYLLIFGAGTMVGMMGMTAAMAVPLTFAEDRCGKVSRYCGLASGVVSLCFGSFLVYQLGFLGGLFTSHPQWAPR